MNENKDEQSFQMLSSQEVIIQFGAQQKELIGSVMNQSGILSGQFGVAQLMLSKGDSTVLMDSDKLKMKVLHTVYRSIITKRNRKVLKKKQGQEQNEEKNGAEVQEQIIEIEGQDKQQNMFESSSEHIQKPKKSKRKSRVPKGPGQAKSHMIRKLRKMSRIKRMRPQPQQ